MWSKLKNFYFDLLYKLETYWWNYHSANSKINGECIMYHHISNEKIDDIPACICRIDVFENTIKNLLQRNIAIVTIDEMFLILNNKDTKKFALITFDDIPESVYTNAYPILKKYQIPFIIFIAVDFINREGFISLEQLKILADDPLCTIGAHTITHSPLRYSLDYKQEISESKIKLETLIGKPINLFAYPYGRRSMISKKCIKEASKVYRCAFSTIQSGINDYTCKKKYFLPRVIRN